MSIDDRDGIGAEDQLVRFNIWTSNLGVFAEGHASVEHRLRDHSIAYKLIVQLLEALCANLAHGR